MNDLTLFIQTWATIIGSLYLYSIFMDWWLSSETVTKVFEWVDRK